MGRIVSPPALAQAPTYDFVACDSTIFQDNQLNVKPSSTPNGWKRVGGKISVQQKDSSRCLSIDQYYTKFSPILKAKSTLGSRWTLELDMWLDAAYDGNPGVQIGLEGKGEVLRLVPNRDDFSMQLSSTRETAATPDDISHDLYYNRWLHLELSFSNNVLTVYCNHHYVMASPALPSAITALLFYGDASTGMNMLLKDVRIAVPKRKAS